MKLLLDENLSPRLVEALAEIYPGSEHVDTVELGSTSDDRLWTYAKENGFAIVSKDSDFADLSVLMGAPPKVIWIRMGNCTTFAIEELLRSRHEVVRRFLEEDRETCLLLG